MAEQASKKGGGKVGKKGDDDGPCPAAARKVERGKVEDRLPRGIYCAGAPPDVGICAVLRTQLPYQRQRAAPRKGLTSTSGTTGAGTPSLEKSGSSALDSAEESPLASNRFARIRTAAM